MRAIVYPWRRPGKRWPRRLYERHCILTKFLITLAFHTPLLNSYRSQVEHYTAYIKQKKKWKFAGIYSDEAITGTRVAKREDFQRLINDCLNGDVDMILTKSMIRFIRMSRSLSGQSSYYAIKNRAEILCCRPITLTFSAENDIIAMIILYKNDCISKQTCLPDWVYRKTVTNVWMAHL